MGWSSHPRAGFRLAAIFAAGLVWPCTATAEVPLSGQVSDQHDVAVAGAQITFGNQATGADLVGAQTDSSGRYRVDLAPVLATHAGSSSWAQIKRRPARKPADDASEDTLGVFWVIVTHPQIDAFAADSLRVPDGHVLDFRVQRLVPAPDTTASVPPTQSDTTRPPGPDPDPGDGAPDDGAPDDGAPPAGALQQLVDLEVAGDYLARLVIAAVRSPVAVGDPIRLHFIGHGLREVRQIDLSVEIPAGSIALGEASFAAQAPFSSPGGRVDTSESPIVRFGGASFSATVAEDTFDFGELVLPTTGLVAVGEVRLRRVSVGKSSGARDVYEDLDVSIPILVK